MIYKKVVIISMLKLGIKSCKTVYRAVDNLSVCCGKTGKYFNKYEEWRKNERVINNLSTSYPQAGTKAVDNSK